MTYDEAVEAVRQHLPLSACDCSECVTGVLDAIGFRQMQERIADDLLAMERLEAERVRWVNRAGVLAEERDAARALADRLARELTDVMGGGDTSEMWLDRELAAAYEARAWK